MNPIKYVLLASLLCAAPAQSHAQSLPDAPRPANAQATSPQAIDPQAGASQMSSSLGVPASISGRITDADAYIIPDTTVSLDGETPADHQVVVSDDQADFTFQGLRPGVTYRMTIHAKGFTDWTSAPISLNPGQTLQMDDIKLIVGEVMTTVSAVSAEKVALEQVQNEEKQRVFGFIPNFYVVYDPRFVPLTTKLKFQLAARSATDVVTFGSAAFLGAIDQAAFTPSYVEGGKGYGQRVGAVYANAATNIMIGGAILPTLFHQDPRYFYQGEGTKKSRAIHALSSPFVAKGDNGRWQPNYSSLGGDLASNALANVYYPPADRGAGLVFSNMLISTGGRMVNSLVQEFLLRKFTSHSKSSF